MSKIKQKKNTTKHHKKNQKNQSVYIKYLSMYQTKCLKSHTHTKKIQQNTTKQSKKINQFI